MAHTTKLEGSEPTLEPSLEDLAIEAAELLDSLPTYVSDQTIHRAQQIAFALRACTENARARVSDNGVPVDQPALAEWLDMLVVALKASQKFDYNEWGQFIMGAESWADKLRAAASPVAPQQSKAHYEKAHDARYQMTHPVHPDIVVLWFLALKSHWFDDPNNMFHGQREAAKAYLYKWVETGELADDNSTLEITTAMKFREWLVSSWTAPAPSAAADDESLSDLLSSERLNTQEAESMKNYDDFRAGMLRAAEMARNEFKRAPEAAKGHDCVYMGGYEDACDHLSVAIAQAAVIDCVRIAGSQPDWQYHIALLLPEGIADEALLKIYQVVEHELRTASSSSTQARAAARAIASALERDEVPRHVEESEPFITAIIERCLSEGEALTLDEVQE